ncbi:hypothetical protein H4W79_004521 [Nocardiopsis terrae]|uniref:Uncharacterized protein n=1 Tax=Nocardiopsis terrae TaxID=372655 RepID=A0ABR9HMS8_9ACTN|nr:hypothetical protein [Nocardiopsis terrae]
MDGHLRTADRSRPCQRLSPTIGRSPNIQLPIAASDFPVRRRRTTRALPSIARVPGPHVCKPDYRLLANKPKSCCSSSRNAPDRRPVTDACPARPERGEAVQDGFGNRFPGLPGGPGRSPEHLGVRRWRDLTAPRAPGSPAAVPRTTAQRYPPRQHRCCRRGPARPGRRHGPRHRNSSTPPEYPLRPACRGIPVSQALRRYRSCRRTGHSRSGPRCHADTGPGGSPAPRTSLLMGRSGRSGPRDVRVRGGELKPRDEILIKN